MSETRRGRRYTRTEVDELTGRYVAELHELRAENRRLADTNRALLRQLADADRLLLQIETDTTRLGGAVRELVEETEWNAESEPRRLHPSAFSTGGGTHPPALRLITNHPEGER
jgi:cell division septum initiation protein DivIVA